MHIYIYNIHITPYCYTYCINPYGVVTGHPPGSHGVQLHLEGSWSRRPGLQSGHDENSICDICDELWWYIYEIWYIYTYVYITYCVGNV